MAGRVLVTGAASGLGRAIAARYTRAAHRVLVSDVDGEAAARTAKEIGASAIGLDVTSESDWAGARDWCEREWGGLDVLVNNAGVGAGERFEKITADDVADQVFTAVARKKFLLLTHPDGRRSALLTRFGLTDGQVRKYWTRLRAAVEKGER